jgi:hypothetical protein
LEDAKKGLILCQVTDDLPQLEQGDYRYRVGLEVVPELAPREHHRIEELLDLWLS